MTVVYILRGGLGNQLFILSAALSYSFDKKEKIEVYFEKCGRREYFDVVYKNIKRVFSLEGKNVKEFDHFQNLKYFHHNKENIIKFMKLDSIRKEIGVKYQNLINSNDISIHFRLGDYKFVGQVINFDYYIDALNIIEDMLDCRRILIFYEKEDDKLINRRISILEEFFPSFSFNKINTSIVDYEQMFIMSHMKCNIIPNSTFSWWSAYLNNGIVIYPKNYILDDNINLKDWIGC